MANKLWFSQASSWACKAGLHKLKPSGATTAGPADHGTQQPLEGSEWADVTAEVIEDILGKLGTKDRWNSRLISSRWRGVFRDHGGSVVVTADPDTVWCRPLVFLQQQYPKTRFTLKLAISLDFTEIAGLLSVGTVAKGNKLSSCDLEVNLATKNDVQPSDATQFCNDVNAITAAAHTLQKRDVIVGIRLQAALESSALTHVLLHQLGPLLLSIDSHQVLDLSEELLQVSDFTTKAAASFPPTAVAHLRHSPIQSLSLSDHSIPRLEACKGLPLNNSISGIAALQHLTQLHLSVKDRTDFNPLTQLTSLEDLALQAVSRQASACQVLHSNRHSLQHVILSSRGWDSATFQALHGIPMLDCVTIKVLSLTDSDAATLSSLLKPSSLQIMLRNCSRMHPQDFHTLTSGPARLTHLELWEMDEACFTELQSVQSLCGLTLVRPSLAVTGQGFMPQPRLDTLRLISCFGMNDDGFRELVAGAPALKILMMQQEIQYACPAELKELKDMLTKHGLVSLAEATELMYVDLQGVRLTRGGQRLLESSICAQQKAGKMRSAIALVVPKFSGRYGEPVFSSDHLHHLHYPAFIPCAYPAFDPCRSRTIHCGGVSKDSQLKGVLSALQTQQVLRT